MDVLGILKGGVELFQRDIDLLTFTGWSYGVNTIPPPNVHRSYVY